MMKDTDCNKVRIVDSIKALSKDGIANICIKYGTIKKINFHKQQDANISYVEFEDLSAAHKLIKDKSQLPSYLMVYLIYDKEINKTINSEVDDNFEVDENSEVVQNSKTTDMIEADKIQQSVYLGSIVSVNSLVEESKQLKLNSNIVPYNLENDDLFGKPLTSKWEKFEKSDFELNNASFSKRFKNCTGGEIKIEKKLGLNVFTGWVTIFNDGENVKNILKSISDDIENSDALFIGSLKRGMLVGAFDSATKLYGRGYVELVSGNSVNVSMSDYGRVINTTIIRTLPEKHTQKPAYSFKVFTKDQCVPQLKEKPYMFKVCSASSERIVLIIFDENKEIKVQLKIWQPSVEEFGVPYIEFKNRSFVELLKLKDMNSVCLRSAEKNQIEFFFSSWNSLAFYCYKTPQFLNREPLYGEIVGFKSSLHKNFTRGRIHKYLGDNTYCVKHMDNPIKENIKLAEMIELQFEHKIMPVSFIKVRLEDALYYPIEYEAKNFVNHLIGARLLVEFDESDLKGWEHVSLQIVVVKENLNNILYSLVEPSWFKDSTTDLITEFSSDFCGYFDLLYNQLKENSVVTMKFVCYHDGIFYMRDNDFGKSFILLSNMIKEYCSLNLHPYLPHIEELCLGQFPDGYWYRISCDDLRPGELTRVHSVDLGNVAFLNSKNMKKLPVDLTFHPSHVYPCILDTDQQLNANNLKLLETYQNTDFEFTVIESLDKNHYLIKCPLLEDILLLL